MSPDGSNNETRQQAVAWFDLPQVGKSPSRFDFRKLENLNSHYIREADDERLAVFQGKRTAGVWAGGHHKLSDHAMDSSYRWKPGVTGDWFASFNDGLARGDTF